MKTIKLNTVLPKGGKLLKKPLKKKTGNWVEMIFDAEVLVEGIRWLRVQGGMGQGSPLPRNSNPREDWVADIPHGCASVHDYQFREPRWGFHEYNSFEEACREQLKNTIARVEGDAAEAEAKAHSLKKFLKNFRAGRIQL